MRKTVKQYISEEGAKCSTPYTPEEVEKASKNVQIVLSVVEQGAPDFVKGASELNEAGERLWDEIPLKAAILTVIEVSRGGRL